MSITPIVPGALELAHQFVSKVLSEGDHAIDATAGNGHDTLFLARIVGPGGRVSSFDIQDQAISKTREKVRELGQVKLFQSGHENIAELVFSPVKAVMFNLGYLPSGDKSIITSADTSIKGIEASLKLLCAGGLVTVTAYTGHSGGSFEAEAIEAHLKELPQDEFKVARFEIINQRNQPPHLLVVERLAGPL